jgi:signal transduction histidine kinase
MRTRLSLRGRLFVALFLTAAVPSALLLLGSSLLLREIVVGTGSAGPWDEVAASGSALLDALAHDAEQAGAAAISLEVTEAATRHRDQLSESVRLSRLYAFLGERVLGRLPWVAGGGFLIVAGLSLWSAKQVSRTLSRPVREIVQWTERMGRDEPLPLPDPLREGREIREFKALRQALRTMEGALRQARTREVAEARNRSWSEMARRIAHDLKNPLTPMRMAARTAAQSTDPQAVQAGEVLLEEIARLDELSRSFAQFGRPPEGPPSPVDLNELVLGLAQRIDPEGTLVEVEIQSPAPGVGAAVWPGSELGARGGPQAPFFVEGHPVALERVVRNLVANALDAAAATTGRTGVSEPVRIVLSGIRLGAGSGAAGAGSGAAGTGLGAPLTSAFGHIEIEILDRGPGLPSGDEARIWEPDFTTKRRGTGLGLPLVRQVIEAHGGTVHAETRVDGGASFRVRIPALEPPRTTEVA